MNLRSRRIRIAAGVAALVAVATGVLVADRAGGHEKPTPPPVVRLASSRPAASPAAAVEALLGAEVRGDHEASFHLLSSAGLAAHPDVESWERRRIELPEITSFRVEGVNGDTVTVATTHEPGLDPFVGLRAAHDTQRWHVRHQAGGWLVDPEPAITLVLPGDGAVPAVARAWATAVQACDRPGAEALQVEPELVGVAGGLATLCRAAGTVTASKATRPRPGPTSADLVAQYGDDALEWGRASRVRAGGTELTVLLAPIGSAWRVVGVTEG